MSLCGVAQYPGDIYSFLEEVKETFLSPPSLRLFFCSFRKRRTVEKLTNVDLNSISAPLLQANVSWRIWAQKMFAPTLKINDVTDLITVLNLSCTFLSSVYAAVSCSSVWLRFLLGDWAALTCNLLKVGRVRASRAENLHFFYLYSNLARWTSQLWSPSSDPLIEGLFEDVWASSVMTPVSCLGLFTLVTVIVKCCSVAGCGVFFSCLKGFVCVAKSIFGIIDLKLGKALLSVVFQDPPTLGSFLSWTFLDPDDSINWQIMWCCAVNPVPSSIKVFRL